ncbi:MAG: LytTR family transcriptional regulator DNA-binding domain-containing protein [Bacteroidales bacterium]|nr:LytTR family transcriptional regulator DNA-binding domain-containing protein [Bacteroidales bacterium]
MLQVIDDIFLLLGGVLLAELLVYTVISGISIVQNTKSRKKLRQENADLTKENKELRTKLAQFEGHQKSTAMDPVFVRFGTMLIQAERISYLVSQSFDMPAGGDSRVKVIHYTDTEKTDSVYETFDGMISQLPDYFMLVNKNQLVNLHEISKVDGSTLYLRKVRIPFTISDSKLPGFLSRFQ